MVPSPYYRRNSSLSHPVTKGALSCSLPVIRYDNSIINAVSVKNLEK